MGLVDACDQVLLHFGGCSVASHGGVVGSGNAKAGREGVQQHGLCGCNF